MKIHYLSLKNYRGVSERTIEFADAGVTVVEGANELGKTSAVEAIDLLLDEPDTSAKRRVKAVQPIGLDTGTEVEAEFSVGPYRFVYRKRWNKQPETTLRIVRPALEQITGRPAHDRVRTILAEALDQDLWAALRVEQQQAIEQVALGDNDSLARALDTASGGARETGAESTLYERIEHEYLDYFTAKGRPTNDYRVVSEALDQARAKLTEAEEAVRAVELDVDRHAEVRGELRNLEERVAGHEHELASLEERWAVIEKHRLKVEELQNTAEHERRTQDTARLAHEQRQQMITDLHDKDAALQELQGEQERSESSLAAAENLTQAADTDLAAATATAVDAGRAAQLAADDVSYLRDRADLDDLTGRRSRAGDAARRIEVAESFLATCQVDDALLDELEAAHLALARAEAARTAAVPRIAVEALAATEVLLDDTVVVLAPGSVEHHSITRLLSVEVPGVLRVRVTPGAGEHDSRVAVEDAEGAFKALCERGHVTDLASARALCLRRRDAQRDREVARDQLAQALADSSTEEIGQAIARLSARIANHEHARPDEPAMPSDLREAQAAEEASRNARSNADRRVARAAQISQERQGKVAELQNEALVRSTRIEALGEELASLVGRLDELRAETPDAALTEALVRANTAAAETSTELDRHGAELLALRPDQVLLELNNARTLSDRFAEDLDHYQQELARLRGRLEVAGDEGRQDRLGEAQAAWAEAERRHKSVQARARAAERLYETVARHRDAAKEAYVAPFRHQLERLGRIVFGDDLQLDVDRDLRIRSRTLSGTTVPYEQLSTGAREQLCIISRLACATLVEPNDGVPLIIDDALGHSDPRRLERIGAVFAAVTTGSQVIVLTCVPARYQGIGSAKVVRLTATSVAPDGRTFPHIGVAEAAAARASVSASATDGTPAEAVLDCLRSAGRPLGRAEILELTGLRRELWSTAIASLLEEQKVRRIGERRGATYVPTA